MIREPVLSDERDRRLAVHGGVMQIGILSRGMIAPDDHLVDLGDRCSGFLTELGESPVVIEARHRGEPIRRKRRRVTLSDQRIGVRGIADHQDAHVATRDRIQRLALGRENLGVLEQQILALHAGAARPCAHQHRDVAILEGYPGVVRRRDLVEREKRAVVQLHHHALDRSLRGGNLQQIQIDGLVEAQHLAGGDAKCECISDLAGGARDRDGNWFLHADPWERAANGSRTGAGSHARARIVDP
jgi:hypothetical protein